MALFGSTKQQPVDQATADALREEIARLQIDLKVKREEVDLTDQNITLKDEIAAKKRELSEVEEDHEKKIREVEHKVGLQQQKAEQDQKAAVEKAKLEVEKANLTADRTRFDEQMKFEREHLQQQIGGLEHMVDRVMTLVPQHRVNENINRNYGTPQQPEGEAKALGAGDDPED